MEPTSELKWSTSQCAPFLASSQPFQLFSHPGSDKSWGDKPGNEATPFSHGTYLGLVKIVCPLYIRMSHHSLPFLSSPPPTASLQVQKRIARYENEWASWSTTLSKSDVWSLLDRKSVDYWCSINQLTLFSFLSSQ